MEKDSRDFKIKKENPIFTQITIKIMKRVKLTLVNKVLKAAKIIISILNMMFWVTAISKIKTPLKNKALSRAVDTAVNQVVRTHKRVKNKAFYTRADKVKTIKVISLSRGN